MERKQITDCFGGYKYTTKKAGKADIFIDKLEPIIELWKSLDENEPKIKNSILCKQLEKIVSQSEKLLESIKQVDQNMQNGFSTELETFYIKNKKILSVDDAEFMLNSLTEVGEKLKKRMQRRSNSKESEKYLARMVADCYLNCFEDMPGTTDETNYSKILKTISSILKINIGGDITKEVALGLKVKNQ